MVGYHNVLVAKARANREADSDVCVQFANVLYVYMQLIGRWDEQQRGVVWGEGRYGGHLGLCMLALSTEPALTGLFHVAAEGLGRNGAVLAGVMVSETSLVGVVSGFDGGYPGGAYREAIVGV